MSNKRLEDQQTYYICGQCKDKQWYLKTEEPPNPCPDCGYVHLSRDKYDVPSEVKLDLSKY